MPGLATLQRTRSITDEYRRQYSTMQRALTEIRIYTNRADGSPGLVCRGRLNVMDCVKHQFPRRNNTSAQGFFTVRAGHYLAKLIATIPNDPDECKNVVIRVDRYGGAWRWTGMMHHWDVETRDGVDYLTATFNDDLQVLQFLLCPPNPALPIPVFQFPRDFFLYCPSAWGAAVVAWINVGRQEGNLWTLPDDPFDLGSWTGSFDTSTWQVHIKCPPFFEDSSLWGLFVSRMNSVDSIIADPLEDAQISVVYRRYFTDEGEQVTGLLNNNIANGALVVEFLDRSGFAHDSGTFLSGDPVQGFARSVVDFGASFVEDTFALVDDDESLMPDEYWQSGWLGTLAAAPGVCVRDTPWSELQSKVTHSPATAHQVIVGGDNPTADAIAKLVIESVGNILGYLLLFGFDSLGDIGAEVIMPFLVGTIAAWDQFENGKRATNLGWVHLWEVFQSGADQNAWSLSALATARGGMKDTEAQTSHSFVVDESSWLIPGVHADIGHRIGSTSAALQRMGVHPMFVNQIEEMALEGDETGASRFVMKCGKNRAAMSRGERNAQMFKKALDKLSDIGVHLVS